MSIKPQDVDGFDPEHAHRLVKMLANGILDYDELTVEEWGMLYLYYPELLGDVER